MSKLTANLLLLFAAALWGFGNVAQKMVLDHLDALSAVGLRCLIGGLLVLPFVLTERRRPAGARYFSSLVRVVALFAVSILLQQLCYLGTTVTNASFLISTATVITPLAAWLLIGERPTAGLILAAGSTVVGCLLLSGAVAGLSGGDLTALLSAGCYALWTVELRRHMQTHARPLTAAAAQFLAAAALALPLGAMQGNLSLTAASAAGPELVVLGVFSTAVAFGIMIAALRFTSASHAAVIVSAESVFGALGGSIFLGRAVFSSRHAGCHHHPRFNSVGRNCEPNAGGKPALANQPSAAEAPIHGFAGAPAGLGALVGNARRCARPQLHRVENDPSVRRSATWFDSSMSN
ncbi:DMT family transporter [Mesorhizobium sp. dw_380]|uniref:DMT family transporter n=1 Tax=Mesorhizobium sp. dw_380 TaxID=2812001 RepID=UPI00203249DE|nr:DMT family transporter [Mesorhizobium sp. dw_380]